MIKVLVVDDSALIREVLSSLLSAGDDIHVVGTACDPIDARGKIKTLNPDVVTLDIEMPNMNGLAFLEKIMRLRPTPVVMISTLTQKGAQETLLALELGAVDFVAKPGHDLAGGLEQFGREVRDKVIAAAQSDVRGRAMARQPSTTRETAPTKPIATGAKVSSNALIAIGASTGGVEAVKTVLSGLPKDSPPIVIAQHMPAGFTARFAQRLNETCELTVVEAKEREVLKPGHAYIAPGDSHLRVEKSSGQLKCRLGDDGVVSGHRPSVDVLFESVAKQVGADAVAAILTGMGKDGANGMKLLHDAGARTFGQSKSSALIYGMPRAAMELGAIDEELSVEKIAAKLISALERRKAAA
ncbi:protein-glutamate methylesterase/protein-glutamine glutaminase [Maritalea porphyrae]|jgi:two-component system chemotaxis response regulator CheB|uniref:protein-glutamate methylesterase/protein-glutamine glutaminase n=1 Tax=Maritalea porphyrae TaxID=880732 RepID=UPI0022AECD5C|nr:chemotaxis response regulator protein-glutamate methylesterase [Maritalea porphyrae]MCZ4271629.1 chemotaxis response regulator protein-glutamate methylesterase [Maritalea porphyrae]